MPQLIELEQTPNQSFSIILEGFRYDIRLAKTVQPMVADISRDNVEIIMGTRCLPDYWLLPYEYMEGDGGNFRFITENDELPDYPLFGATQNLFYFTAEELAQGRGES